jgi:hypothetical protein
MVTLDLTKLLNLAMPFAIERLCGRGGFQPFVLCVDNAGDIAPYVARNGGLRKPNRKEISQLYRHVRNLALSQQVRAIGMCREIPFRAPNQSELGSAILCSFEHVSGDALEVVLPFKFDLESMSFEFGPLLRKQRRLGIFENRRRMPMAIDTGAHLKLVRDEFAMSPGDLTAHWDSSTSWAIRNGFR